MLRKFSSLCCFILAIALMAGQSKANLLLSATAGGSSSAVIQQGDSVVLNLSLTVTQLPYSVPDPVNPNNSITISAIALSGLDLRINSGSNNPFGDALSAGNGGGWLANTPGQPDTTRFWTGGPTGFLLSVGQSINVGTIQLRGDFVGNNFSTNFAEVVAVEGLQFTNIPMTFSNFSYSVVPEPSSAMLLSLAASGLAFFRRRS